MFRHRAQHGLPFVHFPLLLPSTCFIQKVSDLCLGRLLGCLHFRRRDGMGVTTEQRHWGTWEYQGDKFDGNKTQCTLEMEGRVPWMAKLMMNDPGVQESMMEWRTRNNKASKPQVSME